MTVHSVIKDVLLGRHAYNCQWFAGKKLEHGQFPQESVTKGASPQKKS